MRVLRDKKQTRGIVTLMAATPESKHAEII